MGESILYSTLGDSNTKKDCSDITLCIYMGEILPLVSRVTVSVTYKSEVISLPLLIVQGKGAILFHQNWLKHIRLDWFIIHSVLTSTVHKYYNGSAIVGTLHCAT